ncbi:hypothetical protein [Pseudonocardia sp. H11422]|uniref:hypothetical protein n=1 Tax=Pseudonocardia sp. H11422 TaxID=2835866 RepID=UPI001BDD2210|nr:hypothetical protein [Pseudonocardia sp. H11422]
MTTSLWAADRGPSTTGFVGTLMQLYSASALPRRGRSTTVTRPARSARTAIRRGPISMTCRCGAERAVHEHLRPARDCARCTDRRAARG